MKPTYISLILLFQMTLLGGIFGGKPKDTGALRFDGLYYSENVLVPGASKSRNHTYLRFYPDGKMVRAVSASKPEQVAKWITKDNDNKVGKGKYRINDDFINFDVDAGNQSLAHEGHVQGDTLNLNVYSSKSKSSYIENFYFIKIDFAK